MTSWESFDAISLNTSSLPAPLIIFLIAFVYQHLVWFIHYGKLHISAHVPESSSWSYYCNVCLWFEISLAIQMYVKCMSFTTFFSFWTCLDLWFFNWTHGIGISLVYSFGMSSTHDMIQCLQLHKPETQGCPQCFPDHTHKTRPSPCPIQWSSMVFFKSILLSEPPQ